MGTMTLLLCICFSGCEQFTNTQYNEKIKFVGTWQNTTVYPALIMFSSDGACTYGGEVGTWELQDSKLSITLTNSGIVHDYNYWFSNNNRTLLLTKTFGYSLLYTKQ